MGLAVWLALAAGCSSGSSAPPKASSDPRQNVMVIDEGIDLTAADLQGKVVAAFTVVCDSTPAGDDAGADDAGAGDDGGQDGGDSDGGAPTFDELKQQLIAALAVPDQSCRLVSGIDAKPDPLAAVAQFRDRWNNMLRGQLFGEQVFSMAEWTQLTAALDQELTTFSYHGTATSGTVAHDNPAVRLVLVQDDTLAGDAQGSGASTSTCVAQAEVDQTVSLLADPDVADAFVHAPPSQETADVQQAIRDFDVGVVNESFSRLPRAVVEQMQVQNGCSPVDLGTYFTTVNALEQTRGSDLAPALVSQSAGNESTEIDSGTDDLECAPGDPRHLLVGSVDLTLARSTFTNFGACVDVSAPGESIIAPYAGGWLLPVAGTSFSAPLVARQVSRASPDPWDPVQARQTLLGQRGGDGILPLQLFPRDFFYAPGQTLNAGALTSAPLVSAMGMPRFRVQRPAVTRAQLRRALAPILRLRALRAARP